MIEYKTQQHQGGAQKEDDEGSHQSGDKIERQVLKDRYNEDNSLDDNEFDYLVDEDLSGEGGNTIRELEEKRRTELEHEFFMRQVAAQHGPSPITPHQSTQGSWTTGRGCEWTDPTPRSCVTLG